MRLNHYIGGIFLVAGTTIGAAMLAVPVTTGFMGFIPSLLLFFICWLFFFATAIFFVDVNNSIEEESNLITMAGKTLGPIGKAITWILYLLLLYALLAAYIAASAPLFQVAIKAIFKTNIYLQICYFALPVIFGFFIYLGTDGVDFVNRIFMLCLIVTYIGLILFVPSHIQGSLLTHIDWKASIIGIPIVVTSFGYHIIIPTLATYLNHDRKHLILTMFFGSLMTIVFYAIWQLLVLGVVPLSGKISLSNTFFYEAGSAAKPLAQLIKNPIIGLAAHFFSFFAIITSFLGVSLSLADFLTDGFKLKKSWEGRLIAILLTFVPPIIFVFTYQRGFILALDYAGAFVALLLGLLPAAMCWKLKSPKFYATLSGKAMLILIMLISLVIVGLDIAIQRHKFEKNIQHYR